jgi:hypothetical protein
MQKQAQVDTQEYLNYFCYGNNDFGVIPGLFDILPDAGLYLVMMDMKKLILDVYLLTFNTFFNSNFTDTITVERTADASLYMYSHYSLFISDDKIRPKDTLGQRKTMWQEMVARINRKINFPYLEGLGWTYPAGPVIFKCDVPPKDPLGNFGQWGRNITTGISPNASQTYAYGEF